MKQLKAEIPAKGISLNMEYDDYISFNVDCDCSDPDHMHNVSYEISDDEDFIYVTISGELSTEYIERFSASTSDSNFWYFITRYLNPLYEKLKYTYDIWFKGRITVSSSIVLREDAAYNYAKALELYALKLNEKRQK